MWESGAHWTENGGDVSLRNVQVAGEEAVVLITTLICAVAVVVQLLLVVQLVLMSTMLHFCDY